MNVGESQMMQCLKSVIFAQFHTYYDHITSNNYVEVHIFILETLGKL